MRTQGGGSDLDRGMSGIRYDDRYRTVAEGRILDMLRLGGWAHERETPQAHASTCEALHAWVGMGLGVRHHGGRRFFDPVEVVNVLKWAGLQGRHPFWADRYVATGRRMVADLASRRDEEAFEIRFRRTFHAREASVRLRLRMPLPLAGGQLREVSVVPFAEGDDSVRLDVTPGRLEARLTAHHGGDIAIGADLRFKASRTPPPAKGRLGEGEIALYLRPREGLVVVSDRVKDLARSLAPEGVAACQTIRRFRDHIFDALVCGAIHYDQVDPALPCDWVLESGWFDCQLGAALLVALCRARGIPARLIGGHVLYRQAPTNHYWAEAWVDDRGWMPVDFLGWDLSLGGRDLAWRDRFLGHLDHRMTTQILPLTFTGALGVAIPPDFMVLQTPIGEGIEIALLKADGTAVYTDRLAFTA